MTMARGKETCRILKEIRRQIAEANDIEFITSECRYKGDCLGTCPKCEAEVRYLEQQLRTRSLSSKAVVLAGISAGMILMSGCSGKSSNQSNVILTGDTILPEQQIPPVDSEDLKGDVSDNEVTENVSPTASNLRICDDPNAIVNTGEVPEEPMPNPDEKGIYRCAEQMPQFPGGTPAMLRFIAKHLKYPDEQLKEAIQGRVVVKFYVDTLGRVCDPKILRGKDSALDREALRVVRLFPNFTPGTIDGKKVNTYMAVPIVFRLPAD